MCFYRGFWGGVLGDFVVVLVVCLFVCFNESRMHKRMNELY